ncbi:MAG: phosphodiesterase, partial [SAR324 cluster bacterium]|nr:phosphodiesterase [SAR324 cluster bacterium]
TLTVALAEQVDRSQAKKFIEFRLTEETLQEIRYASLLHDFGKIGVRENVLVKAKKLFPHELQAIQDRFNFIRCSVQLQSAEKQVSLFLKNSPEKAKALMESALAEREQDLGVISEALEFILKCNEPTVLAQGGFDQLNEIASRNFFQDNGEKIPFLNEKELNSLSVPKGSLTVNDRKEIESHVTHTYRFLSTIPWTQELRNVPEIAYAHHEKLDGTGYPNGLDASQIPIQAKMMTIADIFDALTAMDRPYKKALPPERALNILLEEAKASHVDTDLLKLFIESEIYQLVF